MAVLILTGVAFGQSKTHQGLKKARKSARKSSRNSKSKGGVGTTKGEVYRKNYSVDGSGAAVQQSALTLKWLISKECFPSHMAVEMHNVSLA
jgi:hypothetical protein